MTKESMDLPEECWELVFNFVEHRHQLSSLSLVCKTFLSITNHLVETLVISDGTALVLSRLLPRFERLRSIDLSGFRGDTDGLLSQIANSGLVIESLDVSKRMTLPIRGLRVFASKMKNLRSLKCSEMGTLRDRDLNWIAQAFPWLEELDVSYPDEWGSSSNSRRSTEPEPISDAGILSLSEKLKSLKKINLSGNHFITDQSLEFLSMNCLLLREIALVCCSFVTRNGVALLISRCANLNSVSAWAISHSLVDPALSDSFACAKALRVVNFSDSFIMDELLYSMAETSLPLNKLILSNCQGFGFDGISFLLSKQQSLQHLDLQGSMFLCDETMIELSKFLRNLTYINITYCRKLTESTVFSLIRNCPLLSKIKMVRANLGAKDFSFSTRFAANHTRIKHLDFGENPSLSDECVKNITSLCPNLQKLELRYCSSITGQGILEALKRCPEIKYLGMNYCTGIKNFFLDSELSKLEVLCIRKVGIDDYGLYSIGNRCPLMLQLDLSCCLNITEKGVKEIVQNCRALKEIDLNLCQKVNIDNVAWLVFSRPSLRKIVLPYDVPSERQRIFFLRHGCLVA